jgi:predicted nucleic acid-binding protein
MAMYAKVRRMRLRDGLSISEIARRTSLSRNTIKAWHREPEDRFMTLFTDLLEASDARGNLVPDCYLAALALEHGLTLVSSDADFARFPDLRWINPLQA